MFYPVGSVRFTSALSMEECGKLLSARLLGGIPFIGGGVDSILDEVPAMVAQSNVIGLEFILAGGGGTRGFAFAVSPGEAAGDIPGVELATTIDLSSYLKGLLLAFPEFENVTDEEEEEEDE